MRPIYFKRAFAVGVTAVASLALTGVAGAKTVHHAAVAKSAGAVFVQSDNASANSVAVYARGADGRLSDQHVYKTGGKGGSLDGSVVDHLASQSSLLYDSAAKRLFAVNAGSDTITTFSVKGGDRLTRQQVIGSNGSFPVSLTVHGDVLYVLNALDGGNVHGYVIKGGKLVSIKNSTRELGLDVTATPVFVNTPGQVAFTPSGKQLIVTTKANGSDIDVFSAKSSGLLAATPTVNSEPGDVPFAVAFKGTQVVVTDAGPDAVGTFTLSSTGTLTSISSVDTGQTATCWITIDGGSVFAGSAGTATESELTDNSAGAISLVGSQATDGGTVDATTSPNGKFLYVQTGAAGIVDEFAVHGDAALTELGSVDVPGATGGEGIAVS